jgi:hypothetical protein
MPLRSSLLAALAMALFLGSAFAADKEDAPAKEKGAKKKAEKQAKPAYDYPPQLPDGKSVVTDESPEFLTPVGPLQSGVTIAKTAPKVDFAYYPGQDYPGKPWSVWGDGCTSGEKYYSAIGDHHSPRGSPRIF